MYLRSQVVYRGGGGGAKGTVSSSASATTSSVLFDQSDRSHDYQCLSAPALPLWLNSHRWVAVRQLALPQAGTTQASRPVKAMVQLDMLPGNPSDVSHSTSIVVSEAEMQAQPVNIHC
jgi:hypothetical protein